MTDIRKDRIISATIVAVALLIAAIIIMTGVVISINKAANKLEPEPVEEYAKYSDSFINTLDLGAGTIYTEGGGSVSYTISDRVSQSGGMLVIYKVGMPTTYVPIDHITRIAI